MNFEKFATTTRVSEELHACNMCGYCVPVCPAYQEIGWESAAPRGKIFFMKNVEMRSPLDRILRRPTRERDFAGRPTEEMEAFTRAVYECTGCGACEAVCHADIPFDGLWDDIKGWLVDEGFGPLPEHRAMLDHVKSTKNLYGKDNEARGAWFEESGVRQAAQPEVLFWVGCGASFARQSIGKAVVKILNAANVRYRVLGREEWCSGAHGGFKEAFPNEAASLAARRQAEARDVGAGVMVTTCPHALAHLNEVKRGRAVDTVDLAELAAEHL